MKTIVSFLLFTFLLSSGFSQANRGVVQASDTSEFVLKRETIINGKSASSTLDSIITKKKDIIKLAIADSIRKDSIRKSTITVILAINSNDTSSFQFLANAVFPHLDSNKAYSILAERIPAQTDEIFYLLIILVLFIALIRVVFPKYFQNIFVIFFQTTFRQKQTKENLLQDKLPSILLNLVFILSAAAYCCLLASYFKIDKIPFWKLYCYSTILLTSIYLGKYIFIKFSAWLLNAQYAAQNYIFAVFIVKKVIGIVLIPFLLILAFSPFNIIHTAANISFLLLILLFIYRTLVGMSSVRSTLKISTVHIFLYLCCVEMLPLLLLGKILIIYLNKTV